MNRELLAALRAEVKAAHKAANRKVSRLRTQKGVELGGTRNDPRRNLAHVKGYNARQLQTYLNELNSFRSRGTQYVSGAMGRTISGSKWREYKRLERRYNEIAERSQRKVRQTFLPSHGMTVGERDNLLRPTGPTAIGNRRPMDPINRSPKGIVSDRALDKLISGLKKQTNPNYEQTVIDRQRKVARKMSRGRGNKSQRERLAKLTDKQFNLLWNYTDFPNQMSTKYHTRTDSDSQFVAKTRSDAEHDIDDYLTWAASQ